MLALCPVFLHFKRFSLLRRLFPPFYYLNGAGRGGFAPGFLLYIAAARCVSALLPPCSRRE